MAIDTDNDGNAYALDKGGFVYSTKDKGVTWTKEVTDRALDIAISKSGESATKVDLLTETPFRFEESSGSWLTIGSLKAKRIAVSSSA